MPTHVVSHDGLAERAADDRIAQFEAAVADPSFVCLTAMRQAHGDGFPFVVLRPEDTEAQIRNEVRAGIRYFADDMRYRALCILFPGEPTDYDSLAVLSHSLHAEVAASCLELEIPGSEDRLRDRFQAITTDETDGAFEPEDELACLLNVADDVFGPPERWSLDEMSSNWRSLTSGLIREDAMGLPLLHNDRVQIITVGSAYRDPNEEMIVAFCNEAGINPPLHPRRTPVAAMVATWQSDVRRVLAQHEGRLSHMRKFVSPYGGYDPDLVLAPQAEASPHDLSAYITALLSLKDMVVEPSVSSLSRWKTIKQMLGYYRRALHQKSA